MDNMIVTKQMIRDLIIYNNFVSVSELCNKIFKDETISMSRFNEVMAYVMELEQDSVVMYDYERGAYFCTVAL